jgi:hypothetical protein
MDKSMNYEGIKGAIVKYFEHETRKIKTAVLSLPKIECKVIEVEPTIKLSDDTHSIECEITDKPKPNIKIMKGRWIELYEYWFERKELNKFVLVLDYYVMMKPIDRGEENSMLIDCMSDTLIKQYINVYKQLQDKKLNTQFTEDLPSFESIKESTDSKRPVCQVVGNFTIPEEVGCLRRSASMDQDVRIGLEYLVSEFSPSANRINIPVTQYDYPSLPVFREDVSEELISEPTRTLPPIQNPQFKLISPDIGIGSQNKEITERLIQEREIRKHADVKQQNDILDMLNEENRIPEQTNFERYFSWRQVHKEINDSNRNLNFQQDKVSTQEIVTCTIEQKTKRCKE